MRDAQAMAACPAAELFVGGWGPLPILYLALALAAADPAPADPAADVAAAAQALDEFGLATGAGFALPTDGADCLARPATRALIAA